MCWGCAISIRNRIALAGVGAALAAAAIAGAQEPSPDPSFSMSVSPGRVRMPGTTELVYRLRMTTGTQAERFSIDVMPPLFRTRLGSGDNVHREGATITPDEQVSLEGPGTLTPTGEGKALIACSPSTGLGAHGYEPRYPGFVVELPARSTSTLIARYRTDGRALWPGSDLRLTMRAGRGTTGYGAATLGREVEVRSPAVALSGRAAPRVELWTSPQSSPGVFTKLRTTAGRQPAGDQRSRHARARGPPGVAVDDPPRRGRGAAPPRDGLDRRPRSPALAHAHAAARRQLRAVGAHAQRRGRAPRAQLLDGLPDPVRRLTAAPLAAGTLLQSIAMHAICHRGER